MANTRDHLTKATGITADVVMKAGAYSNAQKMRSVQTGLTNAARELRAFTQRGTLLGRLGEKLSREQIELLDNAAALLDSIKDNVQHAKERKDREEKATAKKRRQWEREAEQLVKNHFSLPVSTVAEQLGILELYLVAEAVLGQACYMPSNQQLRRRMQDDAPRWAHTTAQWHRSQVVDLLNDFHSTLRYHLGSNLDMTPAQRLKELKCTMDAKRAEVLSSPQSIETIRVWTEALTGAAFIASAMPASGSTG